MLGRPVRLVAGAAIALATVTHVRADDRPSTRPAPAPAGSTCTVQGRVLDGRGQPVAGVAVHAERTLHRGPFAIQPVLSDADGRYRFEIPGFGSFRIVARGAGWVSREWSDESIPSPDAFELHVDKGAAATRDLVVARAAEVGGTVTGPKGAVVGGATVSARLARRPLPSFWAWIDPMFVESTTSAADGSYRLTLVPGEAYEVCVTGGAMLPALSGPFVARSGSCLRVDIPVAAGRWVDVVVIDDGGTGVGGAWVSARPLQPTPLDVIRGLEGWIWWTDDAGRVRVGPFGAETVTLSTSTLEHERDDRSERLSTPADSTIELRLLRRGVVAGRVLDSAGSPAAGVPVRTIGVGRALGTDRPVRTDNLGRFRLQNVSRGTVELLAGEGPAATTQASAFAKSGALDVVLRLGTHAPDRVVLVRILDPEGDSVPRSKLSLGGGVSFEVEGGRVEIHRSLLGTLHVSEPRDEIGAPLSCADADCWVLRSFEGREIDVQLEGVRLLRGRVLDDREVPVAQAEVRLAIGGGPAAFEGSPDPLPPVGVDAHAMPSRTDTSGAFELRVPRSVTGFVPLGLALPEGYVRREYVRVGTEDQDVVIQVRRGIRPNVRVLGPDGAPVPGAAVEAHAPPSPDDLVQIVRGRLRGPSMPVHPTVESEGLFGRTDREGTSRLESPVDPAVAHRLVVWPPSARRDLAAYVRDEWKPSDEVVRLVSARPVEGVVRSSSGRPVPGALVAACASDGSDREVAADDQGSFAFRDLPEGPTTLFALFHAWHQDGPVERAGPSVVVEAGAKDVSLVLDSPELEVAPAPR
jgi:hypothetical protein